MCERKYGSTPAYQMEGVKAAIEGAKSGRTFAELTSYRHNATRVIRRNQLLQAMEDKPALVPILRPLFVRNRATKHKAQMQRLSKGGIFAPTSDVVFRAVEAAVPHTLLFQVRQEIVGDMFVAVMEGRLGLDDLGKRWQEFARNANRMFPKYALPSFYAPAFREGDTSLIETISDGLWT
ncbi:hypothetical protein EAS62_12280 [Bradyrhizobium zhanjiangense]|uniref:Uncharacterized protein n=1 Tax=Bradyrhizobium zhanjiangense TaxID=1325107 RepID=A0ABY0DN24_9BRAD|nr:hypothetical protein EAS62_12280 [Bradyrhizobium zhanjiangense]